MTPESVYDFWLPNIEETPEYSQAQSAVWFGKNDEFDNRIKSDFVPGLDKLAESDWKSWIESPKGAVSCVIALDQFPRNAFRGTSRMYAYDPKALEIAKDIVAKGMDSEMNLFEKVFLYLPYEHSEDLDDQKTCMELFTNLRDGASEEMKGNAENYLEFARKHLVIVERFGRFPHRNEILGRESTPEEVEFLKQPGSGF